MPNTWLDFFIIAIFFINIGIGAMRGLYREIISILALILAFVVAIKFTHALANFLYHSPGTEDVVFVIAKYIIGTEGVAGGNIHQILFAFTYGLSFLLLFVGSFSILEAVVRFVPIDILAVTGMNLTLFYRILGGVLGFIRGYAFCIVFLFVVLLSPISQSTAWTESFYVPKFLPSVNHLDNILGGPRP